MMRSALTYGSARRMREATVSGDSISLVDRSSVPRMIVFVGSSASTEQSSDGCAVSTEICLTGVAASSGRKS